ncbi:MAG: LysR family transcriptional regulator [Hydrogenophaga sp.]|uniref:LysR family transcriptional regulator n=1 Tax=Hydrogenophaga sp. TaxID=1904254 RepID=UPI002ABCDED7|nr:LysR family transcriptional regulator [Hydrogenophaga sp.]MDZ4187671.1 LysR family transcriptional regulator [Hydrogenophaga sp.]
MSFTRFTLRQIEAFLAVSELHNFSAAADRLGLTAQAVSQLIAELESHLQFRLFDRTTRRVALSSAGRDFLPSAQTLMRHVQGTESVADDVRHRAAGVLRIGAPLVLACTALPEAIKVFQDKRPRVVVRIRDLAVDKLVDSVAAGDVDIAVGPDRATGPEVTSEALFDSAWVLWCSPKHPLAKRKRLRWSDLRSQPLVAAGYDHERSVAQMRLSVPEESRVVPLDVVENISTAMGVAAHGRVATLAPAYVGVLASKFGLVMRRVLEPETVRKVCLYKPTLRTLSPAAEGFAEHLSQWLPEWAAR